MKAITKDQLQKAADNGQVFSFCALYNANLGTYALSVTLDDGAEHVLIDKPGEPALFDTEHAALSATGVEVLT